MVISVLLVDPCDRRAAQHHERGSYALAPAWEKIQVQKFEVRFLLNVYCFHTTVRLKNYKSNHGKAVVFNQFWILFKDKYVYTHMYICVYVKYVIHM